MPFYKDGLGNESVCQNRMGWKRRFSSRTQKGNAEGNISAEDVLFEMPSERPAFISVGCVFLWYVMCSVTCRKAKGQAGSRKKCTLNVHKTETEEGIGAQRPCPIDHPLGLRPTETNSVRHYNIITAAESVFSYSVQFSSVQLIFLLFQHLDKNKLKLNNVSSNMTQTKPKLELLNRLQATFCNLKP